MHPHEYERGGTAKLLALVRPATSHPRSKGVAPETNAVLHPWLKEQLREGLAELEKQQPRAELPPKAEPPACVRWETWFGHPPRNPEPPFHIVLVLDNLAGHLSYDLVRWLFDHGVMSLYTPIGGSWPEYWPSSVQHIIVSRALAGQHPKNAQEVIDWLEQTVEGWNNHPNFG